jgi:hypothetical protein
MLAMKAATPAGVMNCPSSLRLVRSSVRETSSRNRSAQSRAFWVNFFLFSAESIDHRISVSSSVVGAQPQTAIENEHYPKKDAETAERSTPL